MGNHALSGVDGFVRRSDTFFVDPRVLIVEEGFNPRKSFGDEEDLALKENIRQNGVIEALKVQKTKENRLVVREGGRRRWACMELIKEGLDVKAVPVALVDKNMNSDNALLLTLNCSNTGKAHTPFEIAGAFKRLVNNGWAVKDIAAQTGRSEGYVYEKLKLVNVTPETRQAVENGEITIKDAANAAGRSNGDEGAQDEAVRKAKRKKNRVTMKYDRRKDDHVIKGATEAQQEFLNQHLGNDFYYQLQKLGFDANSFVFAVEVDMEKAQADQTQLKIV